MTISNNTVAQLFADGATEGDSRNMHIDGDAIYSYGPHFPIARRIKGGYIFNSNGSSISTTKHKSIVRGCIAGHILWELPGCDLDQALEAYSKQVHQIMKAIPKSKACFPHHLDLLKYNFEKAIEASEKLDQDIQPLYAVMDTEAARAAIKRIKKEGKLPGVMLTVFGKAKFLNRDN